MSISGMLLSESEWKWHMVLNIRMLREPDVARKLESPSLAQTARTDRSLNLMMNNLISANPGKAQTRSYVGRVALK